MSIFTVIIPAYRTPQMVAFTVSQILTYSQLGEVEIVIVNNYPDDKETFKYLSPFIGNFKYVDYPKDKLQSHGIAVDYALNEGLVSSDYFMVLESDSYPQNHSWVSYYENLIKKEVDAAGSMLKLSGGLYMHPCGALYSKRIWQECKEYIKTIDYSYFPNMNKRQGFDFHTMIHNSIIGRVLVNPDDYIELADGYKPYSIEKAIEKGDYYKPTCGVFHNGMGNFDEDITTYGQRGFDGGVVDVMITNKNKIIRRVGYEPGQYFSYWMFANHKNVFQIPIEIKWMEGRENQQQEYTLNEAGIRHIWGVSSYTERAADGVEDIYKEKRELPFKLYNSLPEHLKVKL